ncbi:hypothetical protein, partial [Xylanibacter rodentium]|uniref:hypothetical protein n=1 Tax=Xylanibacter rodentium TaxID=2736289 RepID=UPI00255835F0
FALPRAMSLLPHSGRTRRNVFVKPDEQSETCLNSAMVRKRKMKSNVSAKQEARSVCTYYHV